MRRAAAIVTAALVGAGLLVASPAANAAVDQVRATGDYQLPSANNLTSRAKAGPGFTVNPADPNHIVETHQELETEECEYNTSFDGGRTWTAKGVLEAPPGYPGQGDTLPGPCDVTGHGAGNIGQQSVAFGSGNNVYISWTSSEDPRGSVDPIRPPLGFTVLLSRSVDGGRTFSVAQEVPGLKGGAAPAPNFFRPELVIERRTALTDRIYIVSRDARTSRALVVRSEDSGSTWTAPMEASETAAPQPTFDGSGNVVTPGNAYRRATEVSAPVLGPAPAGGGQRPLYVAWRAPRDPAPTAPQGETPPPCPPNTAGTSYCEGPGELPSNGYIVVARSDDGGVTWTRTRAVNVQGFLTPTGNPAGGFSFSNYPRIAAGPEGNVYVTFTQGPGVGASNNCGPGPYPAGVAGANTNPCPRYNAEGYNAAGGFNKADHFIHWDSDAWFIRSTDRASTWRDLQKLNDPKQTGLSVAEITQTRHPQVFVAPDGRVDVVWEDRRHWYITPSARRAAVTPGGTKQFSPASNLANYPCVHTHAACNEARLGDTYYSGSADGGATFGPDRRLNDRSHNNDVGSDYRFSVYWDYGPAAVPLGNNELLVADMDARLGNVETDSLDIFLRRVNVGSAGPIPVRDLGAGNAPALSVALSQHAYPGGSEAVLAGTFATRPNTKVVIVNEGDAAAALAGGVLARANLGPVLASPAGGLPPAVSAEVTRLVNTGAIGAFVLGGTGSLSTQVEADLGAAGVPGAAITRISGGSPAELAANIAATLDPRTLAERTSNAVAAFDAAVIVNPNSASAASASVLAANRRLPVLFVDRDSIPAATRDALNARNITKTLIVGSTGVVSSGVESQLPNPTRLGGGDQFAVSNAVVQESLARGLPKNNVYVADGNEPMHGALLGAAAGRVGGILALTSGGGTAAAEATIDAAGMRPQVDRIYTSSLTGASTVGPDPGDVAVPGPGPGPAPGPDAGSSPVATGFNGYRMVAGDGGIFTFGARSFHGSTGDIQLNKPIVGGATDQSDYDGYWIVASDGGVFAFNAEFHGSLGGETLSAPAVEIEPTPSGKGYWIVLADGKVVAFGDAKHFGDFSGQALNKPVIGMSVTTTGLGYWLVAEDGGIFNFGDADFFGSTGAMKLNAPVIDLAPQVDNEGYYLVARDGGVFTFGSAEFKGSTGDITLNAPVIAMLVAPNGAGYWLAATDGGVFTFGAVEFLGSMGATKLNSPVLDLVN